VPEPSGGWGTGTPRAFERRGGHSGPAAGAHAEFSPHPRKGRRPTLILRTQLSVRVHAIIGESGLLLPRAGTSPPHTGLIDTMGFGRAFGGGERERHSPGLLPPHKPWQRCRGRGPHDGPTGLIPSML